ncbi:MAG: N4-gp56 family major capsid protein, partial [Anaerolineae bacterium]|nr:N4-gp56 family major capsid protein [Anaerolineae bacterium]
MSSFTTYGDVSPRVGIYAVAKALANAQPELCLAQFATSTPCPKNKGQTIKWRRVVRFNVSTTALTEGVTPSASAIDVVDVTATLAQYGDIRRITDAIQDTHEDPILNWASEESGKQAATTKEMLLWNTVRAASNILYSNGNAESSINTAVDEDLIRAGINTLKRNHAKRITKRVSASPNEATEPVNAAFVAVGHTDLERDLRALSGFVPVEKYGQFQPIHMNELGKFEDCRFILTPHLIPAYGTGSSTLQGMRSEAGAAVDVYRLVMFGQDAYGTVSLKGLDSVKMSVFNPGMG